MDSSRHTFDLLERRAPWSGTPIATVSRHASWTVVLTNFHKPETVDVFAIAPGNLNAVFTPKLVAPGSAGLEH
jgi:hypothetical protein